MATPGSGSSVAWEQGRIVPDVVKAVSDSGLLDVRVLYKEIEVANGLAMRRVQTQARPHVEIRGPSAGTETDLYALLMVDPDAPSPLNPVNRCFVHWLLVNIPGCTAPSQEIWETGIEVVPYMGPAPPEGEHRYVFLLFKQKVEMKPERIRDRKKFNVDMFAELHGLGHPVGVKYFVAKAHDELQHSGKQV